MFATIFIHLEKGSMRVDDSYNTTRSSFDHMNLIIFWEIGPENLQAYEKNLLLMQNKSIKIIQKDTCSSWFEWYILDRF